MSKVKHILRDEELTIDEQLKSLGNRWTKRSEKRSVVVSKDGLGHFFVQMTKVVRPKDENEKSETYLSQESATQR